MVLTFPSSSQCIATKLATLLTAQLSYEHAKKYIYLVLAFCLLGKCAQIEYHASRASHGVTVHTASTLSLRPVYRSSLDFVLSYIYNSHYLHWFSLLYNNSMQFYFKQWHGQLGFECLYTAIENGVPMEYGSCILSVELYRQSAENYNKVCML